MRAYNEGSFRVGSVVRAIYSDEENEPAWYDAIIDSFDETNDQRFWVTFTEYGNKGIILHSLLFLIVLTYWLVFITRMRGSRRHGATRLQGNKNRRIKSENVD